MNNPKKIKRKIKRYLEYRSRNISFSFETLLYIFTAVSATVFLITQLVTNSILAPMGKELASIDKERLYLQESTRRMEEDIALSTSLNTRKMLSEKKLKLKSDAHSTIVFVNGYNVIASK